MLIRSSSMIGALNVFVQIKKIPRLHILERVSRRTVHAALMLCLISHQTHVT